MHYYYKRYARKSDGKPGAAIRRMGNGPFKIAVMDIDGKIQYYTSETGFLSDWTIDSKLCEKEARAYDAAYEWAWNRAYDAAYDWVWR